MNYELSTMNFGLLFQVNRLGAIEFYLRIERYDLRFINFKQWIVSHEFQNMICVLRVIGYALNTSNSGLYIVVFVFWSMNRGL